MTYRDLVVLTAVTAVATSRLAAKFGRGGAAAGRWLLRFAGVLSVLLVVPTILYNRAGPDRWLSDLHDGDARIREEGLLELVRSPYRVPDGQVEAVVDALVELSAAPEPEIRRLSIAGLGTFGIRAANLDRIQAALRQGLHDTDERLRDESARSLDRLMSAAPPRPARAISGR